MRALVLAALVVVIWAKHDWQCRREPYQVSIKALLIVTAVLSVAISLARFAVDGKHGLIESFWGVLGSLLLFGGVIGASLGHAFRNKQGGMALWGAIIGAVVFAIPLLAYIAMLEWSFRDFNIAG